MKSNIGFSMSLYIEHFTKHFFSVGKSCLLNIFFYVFCTFGFAQLYAIAYECIMLVQHIYVETMRPMHMR